MRVSDAMTRDDLATSELRAAAEAVSGVSRHGGPHSQNLGI